MSRFEEHLKNKPGKMSLGTSWTKWFEEYEKLRSRKEAEEIELYAIDSRKYQQFCRHLMKTPRLCSMDVQTFHRYLKRFVFETGRFIEKERNNDSRS